MRASWGSVVIVVALLLLCAGPAKASMAVPALGSYDRLTAYLDGQVNVLSSGLAALAVPGLQQFKRGAVVEGCIQAAIEAGALFFLLRIKEETIGGDTYQQLTVNWVAAAVLILNHVYSAASTVIWGSGENTRLRVTYGVDRIIIGLDF